MSKGATVDKTVIKFQFVKPSGFSLTGYGNFWPEMGQVIDENYKGLGNAWVVGYKFDKQFSVEMPGEEVRALPEHIDQLQDEATRTAFKVRQAELAATQHAENNIVRDELFRLQSLGIIKVISDSFYDGKKRGPGRPAKAKVESETPAPPETPQE